MAKKLLTLNIGASSVTLAEYEAGGRSLTLLNYGTPALAAPLDAENADVVLPPALLEIVRERGIRPGKVAISISGQMAFLGGKVFESDIAVLKFDGIRTFDLHQHRGKRGSGGGPLHRGFHRDIDRLAVRHVVEVHESARTGFHHRGKRHLVDRAGAQVEEAVAADHPALRREGLEHDQLVLRELQVRAKLTVERI